MIVGFHYRYSIVAVMVYWVYWLWFGVQRSSHKGCPPQRQSAVIRVISLRLTMHFFTVIAIEKMLSALLDHPCLPMPGMPSFMKRVPTSESKHAMPLKRVSETSCAVPHFRTRVSTVEQVFIPYSHGGMKKSRTVQHDGPNLWLTVGMLQYLNYHVLSIVLSVGNNGT